MNFVTPADGFLEQKSWLFVVAIASTCALFVSTCFLVSGHIQTRKALLRDLEVVVSVIAMGSTAALAFSDATHANKVLRLLEKDSRIRSACLYLASGELLSSFRDDSGVACSQPRMGAAQPIVDANEVQFYRDIVVDNSVVGHLVMHAGLAEIAKHDQRRLSIAVVALILAISMSLLISVFFQRLYRTPAARMDRFSGNQHWDGDAGGRHQSR